MEPEDSSASAQMNLSYIPPPVAEDCLRIPVVLREVLHKFSSENILKLAVVNQEWENEAYELLKQRKNILTTIGPDSPCNFVRAIKSGSLQYTNLTSSGASIYQNGSLKCAGCEEQPTSAEAIIITQSDYAEIIQKVGTKCLSYECMDLWTLNKTCPAFLLLKEILQTKSDSIEKFIIKLAFQQEEFVQDILQDRVFPCMATLQIKGRAKLNQGSINLIKALVSRAPNLKNLVTSGRVNLNDNLLDGSSALHVVGYPYSPSLNQIPEAAISRIRLRRMKVKSTRQDFTLKHFELTTKAVLQSSCAFLRVLDLDVTFLLPFISFGISLSSVTKLKIHVNSGPQDPLKLRILTLAKCMDFTRTFPCLKQLHGFASASAQTLPQDVTHAIATSFSGTGKNLMLGRSIHIQTLILHCSYDLKEVTLRFFSDVTPQIQEMQIFPVSREAVPFFLPWKSLWKDLKAIKVHGSHPFNAHDAVNQRALLDLGDFVVFIPPPEPHIEEVLDEETDDEFYDLQDEDDDEDDDDDEDEDNDEDEDDDDDEDDQEGEGDEQ